jgi:hypothetical protein
MRVLVALPVLAALLAPAPAQASGCFLGPYSVTIDPALGCEVVIVSHPQSGPTDFVVTTQRGGNPIDLTGAITSSTTTVEVQYTNYACDGAVIIEDKLPEPYNVYRIALTGAQVGDALQVNGIDSGTIKASGACTEDMTLVTPSCTGVNSGYPCDDASGGGSGSGSGSDDDDEVGCNAGSGPAGLVLALAALAGRRRRAR